jgi:hypothetical protein
MAVTESRPVPPGGVGPPGSETARTRRHQWRWILLGVSALLTTAVIVLAVLAGTYQPVGFGHSWGGLFPGLPDGTRPVNTFLGQAGQIYAPPQTGVFSLRPSIFNAGPETVTIEAVSVYSPQQQAGFADGEREWPFTPAGSVRWTYQYTSYAHQVLASGKSVAGVKLPPGQGMALGIPLKMSGICFDPNGSTGTNVFYVKERFGPFTHWVTVTFSPALIMQPPSAYGAQGAGPAHGQSCLPGLTRAGP